MLARRGMEVLGDRPVERVHAWERDGPARPPRLRARRSPRRPSPGASHMATHSVRGPLAGRAQALRRNGRPSPAISCWIACWSRPASGGSAATGPAAVPSRWPGGIMPLELPADAVRARGSRWKRPCGGRSCRSRRGPAWRRSAAPGRIESGPLGAGLIGHRDRSGRDASRRSRAPAIYPSSAPRTRQCGAASSARSAGSWPT